MTTESRVLGTWRLESLVWRVVETGEESEPYGRHPGGYIHFTADGRVFAIITSEQRSPVRSEADQIAAFASQVAYTGRYRIEGSTFTTKVDIASDPAWSGIELAREFSLEGDRLTITTAPFVTPKVSRGMGDKLLRAHLIWTRTV